MTASTEPTELPTPSDQPRRRRGRSLWVALLAVATLAALAFGGLSYWHWKDLRDGNDDRAAAKVAAAAAIPKFTSFDYHHLQDDIKRAKEVLTPCFGGKYGATLEQAVTQATQAQAVVTSVVNGAQVLDVHGSLAHAQVFFDQKAVFGDGRPTKVTPYRVVLDLVKLKGAWRVNYLDIDDAGTSEQRPCQDDGIHPTKG